MVNPASTFLLLASAALFNGPLSSEARDLKSGLSKRHPHAHAQLAHQFAIGVEGEEDSNNNNVSIDIENSSEQLEQVFSNVEEGDIPETEEQEGNPQHQLTKRQSGGSLLPSRNPKCANLRIPAFDAALTFKVKNNLAATGGDSWVSGTRMQALLERDTPALSVYNPAYYNNARNAGVVNSEVNALTKSWLDRLPPDAKAMVVDGGAAGDTAAVGVGFINSGFSGQPTSDRARYKTYASREVNYLFREVKRINGAISHRPPTEAPQAWNDFVYMAPPFFAYWGVMNNNFTIAQQAHKQIKAYRDLMRDPATGMWRHVTHNGQWEDANHWGTGMAWAAAGMTRVYATYKNGPFASRLTAEMRDLAAWANEIVAITFARQNTYSGLLPNAYNAGANSNWDDTASSALLASAAFRLAQFGVLNNEMTMISKAAWIRQGIRGALNQQTGWMWAVDPLDWYVKTDKSPESMAFVLLMEAAARDYRAQIGC